MSKTVHILGAGPSGLVVASELVSKGYKVSIYEKNNISGGMCRTWKWKNHFVDTGPHIFHTPNKNLSRYWEKKFKGKFVKGEFWCKNVIKNINDLWDYPLSLEAIKKYPKKIKDKILQELKNKNDIEKLKAKTYEQFVIAELGPTLAGMFFKKYPEKVWGISTSQMTSDWAPKRIKLRKKNTPFYVNEWNAVGKYGTGSIYDVLKEEILKKGGKIYFNFNLKKILHKDYKIKKLVFGNKKTIKINDDDIIISTLPLNFTSYLLGYKSKLKFRGIRSVFLSFKKNYVLPKNISWLYFSDKKIIFNRVTEAKKLSKFVSPKNKTYLTAEITYSKNDKIDKFPEQDLINLTLKHLKKLKIINIKDYEHGSTNKEPFVYPLMFKGYRNELTRTKSRILKYNQLYSIGTGGDFNYSDSQVIFHKAFDLVNLIYKKKDSDRNKTIKKFNVNSLNRDIQSKNVLIGNKFKPIVIAEAGINHNGSVILAKELINQAVKSRCDYIKFQSYEKNSRVSNKVKSANYAELIDGLEENIGQMFNRYHLSFDEQKEVFKYAKSKKIKIFSTPFDFKSVDFLDRIGVDLFKVASMDLVNLPLIEYVARKNKPVILSTGMSSLSEIDEAVQVFKKTGNQNLALLHCNSTYPAYIGDMNIMAIQKLKDYYNIPVGLSDHCENLDASKIALIYGANIIERHFTINKYMEGPDHILSSNTEEIKLLKEFSLNIYNFLKKTDTADNKFKLVKKFTSIKNVKKIKEILGIGLKEIIPTEYETINQQRKSLYAKKHLKKGYILKLQDIAIKGPGGGILPKYLDLIEGFEIKKEIKKDLPIRWEDFK